MINLDFQRRAMKVVTVVEEEETFGGGKTKEVESAQLQNMDWADQGEAEVRLQNRPEHPTEDQDGGTGESERGTQVSENERKGEIGAKEEKKRDCLQSMLKLRL